MAKSAIDKDLKRVAELSTATQATARAGAAPGLALVFLLVTVMAASLAMAGEPQGYLVVIAAVIAGYMALTIGANDVANTMGPAVGARALTMGGALVIAAICEVAGAMLAGGDVVETISRDLLATGAFPRSDDFVLAMIAALLAGALWVNLATLLRAPISTTHTIVGGVVGAGVAASGANAIVWPTVGWVASSWMASPLVGGVLAAAFLAVIHWTILRHDDMLEAARRWVPIYVALMSGVFAAYMASKGLAPVWDLPPPLTVGAGLLAGGLAWSIAVPLVRRRLGGLENTKKQVGTLFGLPLIIAAALLSFAHGANDVANAVGPLAAIVSATSGGVAGDWLMQPLWVLAIGAAGIAVGLALFGPRLIRTVGEEITKLNEIRGFCVALATGTTVLLASALGMPVSSTHVAIGAIFGVGFLRESVLNTGTGGRPVSPDGRTVSRRQLNRTPEEAIANFSKRRRRYLVRRQHVYTIAGAWLITLPAAGVLAAAIYFAMAAVFRF